MIAAWLSITCCTCVIQISLPIKKSADIASESDNFFLITKIAITTNKKNNARTYLCEEPFGLITSYPPDDN